MRIKKLEIDSIAFCVKSTPANMINYLINKSDEPEENSLDPGEQKFIIKNTGQKLDFGINKALDEDDINEIDGFMKELNFYYDSIPPGFLGAILGLIKAAGFKNTEKAVDGDRLDRLESLIVEKLGKSAKDEYSFPESFLPPKLQAAAAKKRIEKIEKAIKKDEENSDFRQPKKATRKQIDGYEKSDDDDDVDPDALAGMPTLTAFLDYHRPPVKED